MTKLHPLSSKFSLSKAKLQPGSWPDDHRPWPLPACPWAVVMRLKSLLFLHWPVTPDRMRQVLPVGLEVDEYDGQAWLSLALYRVRRVRTRLARSLSAVSSHGQVCVQTYVQHAGRPGLFLLDLGVHCPSLVRAARIMMGLNVHLARVGDEPIGDSGCRYRVQDDQAGVRCVEQLLDVGYRTFGEPGQLMPGTLEYFIHERYCAYSADAAGTLSRCELHRRPLLMQPAEARVYRLGRVPGLSVIGDIAEPLAGYAPAMDLAAWLPKRVNRDDPVESRG